MRSFGFALVGCLALCLSSCGPSRYKDELIGKWVGKTSNGRPLTLEFNKDGTASFNGYAATYTLDSSDNCFITTKQQINGQTKFRTKISITNDVLTTTDPDGKQGTFQRIKPPDAAKDKPANPADKAANPWNKPAGK